MGKKLLRIAIAYDFDGTLAPGNMQEHSFIPKLGIGKTEFWKEVHEHAKKNDMDEILSYMYLMLKKAGAKDEEINKSAFVKHGKGIKFFKNLETWFDRVNQYGAERGIKMSHYIISSGIREMIKGSAISKRFDYIFASGFYYDQHNVAVWPALAVNYTNKTQYLFRINKGIINSYENKKLNRFTPEDERPIPFSNIIYLGDGETDVPTMKMLKYKGGHAIAVYDPKKRKSKNRRSPKEIARELLDQGRADYAVRADYSKNSKLEQIVYAIIDGIKSRASLKELKG
jgi:haloacid dehalogenase-like hydrolase